MTLPAEVAPSVLLETAVQAARTAGLHALNNRHRKSETVLVAAHDVKLKLDLECQAIAEGIVREAFPRHAILAEESADKGQSACNPHESPFMWIIDPIDGTVNFTHGMPWWCCSVAVTHNGQSLAGAVFAPSFNELFTAARGERSHCNGQPISVSGVKTMKESMILTGLDQKLTTKMPRLALFRDIADTVQKARVMGAAALDLCRVASGQAEGYFETGVFTWDVAAGGLIVEMAGGRSETLSEPSPHQIFHMATNSAIHDEFKGFLKSRLNV
jgi:myo-inositol-1(or 4)-monophosphatase